MIPYTFVKKTLEEANIPVNDSRSSNSTYEPLKYKGEKIVGDVPRRFRGVVVLDEIGLSDLSWDSPEKMFLDDNSALAFSKCTYANVDRLCGAIDSLTKTGLELVYSSFFNDDFMRVVDRHSGNQSELMSSIKSYFERCSAHAPLYVVFEPHVETLKLTRSAVANGAPWNEKRGFVIGKEPDEQPAVQEGMVSVDRDNLEIKVRDVVVVSFNEKALGDYLGKINKEDFCK